MQAQRIPGYTGYKPAHVKEDEEKAKLEMIAATQQKDGGPRVPGYQGYVPNIKSENVFGATYGSTTHNQKQASYVSSGFDASDADRYKSVSQNTFTPQMQQHVHGNQHPDYDPNVAKQGGLHLTYEEVKAQLNNQN